MADAPVVRSQSYGKSQVRLSRIQRADQGHDFAELTIWIQLQGEFDESYSKADNSRVIATDTMKNTVYVLASQHGVSSIESFSQVIARHFLDRYAHVNRVDVRGEQMPWSRMTFAGKKHPHAFLGGTTERYTCEVTASRAQTTMRSGLNGLQVLKTTGSGFSRFYRDPLTTLGETDDRIFATAVEAGWPCRDLAADWTAARQKIRNAMLDVFANQFSKSVQHTLYEMGCAVLAACPAIDEIEIRMPNQHHLLVNLQPFELANPNEVFVPTSEPFGMISAVIGRKDVNGSR